MPLCSAGLRGGVSRVTRILPDTAPSELGLTGRFNLTFRRY